MRRTLVTGLLLTLALSLIAPPAHAAVDDPLLTKNKLYGVGTIPRSTCAEKPISKPNNVPIAKAYVTSVVTCLNRVWAKQLVKAGVKLKAPKLTLLTKMPAKYCGGQAWEERVMSYCNRQIIAVLDKRILTRDPDDLWIFIEVSRRYAEYVQDMVRITPAVYDNKPEDDEEAWNELARRAQLQSYCLAGAFTASVYRSLPRKTSEWTSMVRQLSKPPRFPQLGSGKSLTYWMNRGFNSRNPKYCNTWTVSSSLVA
ncbi:neutral zinc metallopeptidase [Herbidospora sp. RD11066]